MQPYKLWVLFTFLCVSQPTMNKTSLLSSQLSKHLSLPLLPPGDEIVSESGIEGEGREEKERVREEEVREEEGREADREGERERDREREQVMYMLWNTVASKVHKEG